MLLVAAVAVAALCYGIVRESAGSAPARAVSSGVATAEPVTVAVAETRDVPI